jgi:hypothetical protein
MYGFELRHSARLEWVTLRSRSIPVRQIPEKALLVIVKAVPLVLKSGIVDIVAIIDLAVVAYHSEKIVFIEHFRPWVTVCELHEKCHVEGGIRGLHKRYTSPRASVLLFHLLDERRGVRCHVHGCRYPDRGVELAGRRFVIRFLFKSLCYSEKRFTGSDKKRTLN